MDHTLLVGAAGVIGGSCLTLLQHWVSRIWQNKDKKREQATARTEISRNELRQAYAAFFKAHSDYLTTASRLSACFASAVDELSMRVKLSRDRAEGLPRVNSTFTNLIARLMEQFILSRTEMWVRANELLLLELVASRADKVKGLAEHDLLIPSEHEAVLDVNHYLETDIKAIRAPFDQFTNEVIIQTRNAAGFRKELIGCFSAERWHSQSRDVP